jgi:hypothetical protein
MRRPGTVLVLSITALIGMSYVVSKLEVVGILPTSGWSYWTVQGLLAIAVFGIFAVIEYCVNKYHRPKKFY